MERTDARWAARFAWAVAHQRGGVLEQLAMQLIKACREPDPTRVHLEDSDCRHLGGDRAHLRHRAEVAWVAHEAQARDMAQRMRHPLQACLQCLLAQRGPKA